ENIWGDDQPLGIYWFAAWNHEMENELVVFPAYQIYCSSKEGVHLGGNAVMTRALSFEDLSYTELSKPLRPGIARIVQESTEGSQKIIIPLFEQEFKAVVNDHD
ncbi:MAG: hypothetical protein LBV33_06310, partial [Lachnospiraceae bacterium]|nr:hypothetical protein [Lachnospiraceae bacterium]